MSLTRIEILENWEEIKGKLYPSHEERRGGEGGHHHRGTNTQQGWLGPYDMRIVSCSRNRGTRHKQFDLMIWSIDRIFKHIIVSMSSRLNQ